MLIKKYASRLLRYLLVLLPLVSSGCAHAFEQDLVQAKEFVQEFITREYNGDIDVRLDAVVSSLSSSKDSYSLVGDVTSLTGGPLVVVTNFEIKNANRTDSLKGITVQVAYQVVATTKGEGVEVRRILPVNACEETVAYEVIHTNEGYKIKNPVVPRVSLAALKKQYSAEIEQMSQIISQPKTSLAQKNTYHALNRGLSILNKIKLPE